MKLLYITTNYQDYLSKLGSATPGLENKTYDEQRAELDRQGFGWNGAWGPAFAPLGYEFLEIDSNVKSLQRAWAREQGENWPELSWIDSIPILQAAKFQPDVVLTDTPRTYGVAWLKLLREKCPSVRLILGWSQSPCEEFEVLRYYDRLLSGSDFMLAKYRKEGCRTHFMRHAFNREVLKYLPSESAIDPVVAFAGSIVRGPGYHLEREQLLERMVSAVPVDIYSPSASLSGAADLLETGLRTGIYALMEILRAVGISSVVRRSIPLIGKAATWKSRPVLQVNKQLRARMKNAVYGLEMYKTLQRSAVSLNNHIECTGPDAANQRLFEATGAGACLLTDSKPNLREMFEEGKEVLTFDSAEDCVEKAQWLLDHPRERDEIASAGQDRTLRDHTYHNRAIEMDALIRKLI